MRMNGGRLPGFAGEKQLHWGGPYARVDKRKVLFDYLKPAYFGYDNPWMITADGSNLVGKVYNLCRVSIYSNSRVLGHGRLEWPYLTWAGFVLKRIFVEKGKRRWVGVPMGVLPWKIEIRIKEMTTWVTLPRDFT
jgi:hypothetical protein